jgi:hypothetical protein
MSIDPLSLPQPVAPPPQRLEMMRSNLLARIPRRERANLLQRTPHLFKAVSRRRLALVAGLIVLIATVGSAAAFGPDFLAEQERVDKQPWTPPEVKAVGGLHEVRRGADWSFMAWRRDNGICVAYAAGSATDWARSCGQTPDPADDMRFPSDYLITSLIFPRSGADGRGAIVGAVTADVGRVELELGGGRALSAATEPAPAELGTDGRLFIVRVPREINSSRSSSRPISPVRAYVFYGHDGRRLERYATG